MPAKSKDPHGNVPDTAPVALLLIDVINDLEFAGNASLVRQAKPMAEAIAALKRRSRAAGIPAIYVNDNFGRWQSNFQQQVAHCLLDDASGQFLAERLQPEPDDYFVLKPKHSGFFASALELVLRHLAVHTVVVTGIAADRCVLFTAGDAFMRDLRVVVPSDCVASESPRANRQALDLMARVLMADIRPSTELDLARLKKQPRQKR